MDATWETETHLDVLCGVSPFIPVDCGFVNNHEGNNKKGRHLLAIPR